MSADNQHQNIDQLETKAKQVASLLGSHAQRLDMRTLKQLEDGRARAVSLHQKRQGSTVNSDGTLSQWTSMVEHHRFAFSGLVLAAIIGSFIVMQGFQTSETSDAFLLGADLPPEAFVDLGFEPSLNKHAKL